MIRYGRQEPTFSTVGEYAHSLGMKAVKYFTMLGVSFYPCQRNEMEAFLALGEDKRFACRTICISKPRQNGKSYSARFYAIWKAVIEHKSVLYSAHHGKTTRVMFNAVKDFVVATESVSRKLKPGSDGIRKAAGLEGFYFADGGCIEFQTRTNSGGRGVTYDVIIIDEAQELTDEQLDAIKPTTIASESGDPQMIYLGTPPNVKCVGTVFRGYHEKAHSGDADGIWWMEWAVEELPDMSDKDKVLELAYMTNPALGYRIKEDVMVDVIATATMVDGFAREYLGWWMDYSLVEHAISLSDWNACKVDTPPSDPMVYAVKFSPDGAVGSIAVCTDDEPPFVEVAVNRSMRRGVAWFANWLADRAERVEAIVVDGKSNAQTLNDKLLEMDVDEDVVVRPSAADVVAANTAFVDATRERSVSHAGQPALADSATLSGMRKIGRDGGFGFESNDNADATMVEACALAYWCAMSIRRNPPQELRIG